MQSLISQIANLFATQSLKSIENSGLQPIALTDTEFGGLLEEFTEENYAANIAALDGNLQQTSYTPAAFQITQFTLRAQPVTAHGEFEYSGQIINTHLSTSNQNNIIAPNLGGNFYQSKFNEPIALENIRSINSTPLQGLSGHQQSADFTTASQISVKQQVSIDTLDKSSQQIPAVTLVDQSLQTSTKILVDPLHQSAKRYELSNDNLSKSNFSSNALAVNSYAPKNFIDENYAATNIQSNSNDINNDQVVKRNSNGVIDNEIINDFKPNQNNAVVSNKLEDEPVRNIINSSSLAVESKLAPVKELEINNYIPSITKDDVPIKLNSANDKLDVKTSSDGLNNFGNRINNSSIINQHESTGQLNSIELSSEDLEVAASKQIYNQLQQDEVKRFDNRVRDESLNNRANILDQTTQVDNLTKINGRIDSNVDLIAEMKNQEIVQDVKLTPNNNLIVDKTYNASASPIEQLNIANKITGLEKSPLQLGDSNQVNNGDELAQHIVWARNNNSSNVKIAITPEHLGALEINIESDIDGLNIQFMTQSAMAKDALEAFMPRLKEMLEQGGLNLQNANVSQQNDSRSSNAGANNQQFNEFDNKQVKEDHANHKNNFDEANAASSKNYLLEAFA